MKVFLAIVTTAVVPVFIALTVVAKPVWMAAPYAFVACCFAAFAVMDWILWGEAR